MNNDLHISACERRMRPVYQVKWWWKSFLLVRNSLRHMYLNEAGPWLIATEASGGGGRGVEWDGKG